MAHELATSMTKWVYTDGCSDEYAEFYLDDEDPTALTEHFRTLLAEIVEQAIGGHMLCYDLGPTDEVVMHVVAGAMPKPLPSVGDVRWTLGWLMERPGSPIRQVKIDGKPPVRYILVYEEMPT